MCSFEFDLFFVSGVRLDRLRRLRGLQLRMWDLLLRAGPWTGRCNRYYTLQRRCLLDTWMSRNDRGIFAYKNALHRLLVAALLQGCSIIDHDARPSSCGECTTRVHGTQPGGCV
ncbi:hypothetical protein M011DRAFT_166237 [Sporormia fimetaria CBS 119925]|uniref:Uncharacterized protein n=1 Tax=Sporormia fimetaria CBS 119925 TaxID=1340428 RepID=A0A6A6V590_9PLEO|nr:hypothetical protein M011DRAFT_166237 [Sporormia fimetaria CBS 119925]